MYLALPDIVATLEVENCKQFVNELNEFYARFNKHDFQIEQQEMIKLLKEKDLQITVSEKDVDNLSR